MNILNKIKNTLENDHSFNPIDTQEPQFYGKLKEELKKAEVDIKTLNANYSIEIVDSFTESSFYKNFIQFEVRKDKDVIYSQRVSDESEVYHFEDRGEVVKLFNGDKRIGYIMDEEYKTPIKKESFMRDTTEFIDCVLDNVAQSVIKYEKENKNNNFFKEVRKLKI